MPELDLRPVTGTIGAVVAGVDLRGGVDDALAAALHEALLEHLVLFLPEQHLSDEDHIALAEAMGTPNVNPNSVARGIEHPLEWIEDTPSSPPKADLWHTDVAYSPTPPDIGILCHVTTPDAGGDTMWANLYAAHDLLSPTMQSIVGALRQEVHPGEGLRETLRMQFGDGVWESVTEMYQGASHPLVRVHPETGRRALYLCGAYFRGIEGLTEAESEAIMSVLRQVVLEPGLQCRWRWTEGDVAIWDERCTNHRGLGDHFPRHRVVRRCTVGSSAPFGPGDAGIGEMDENAPMVGAGR